MDAIKKQMHCLILPRLRHGARGSLRLVGKFNSYFFHKSLLGNRENS